MSRLRAAVVATAMTSMTVLGGASAALAQTDDCEAYSDVCPTVSPTSVTDEPTVISDSEDRGDVLPFTGGNLVLMTLAGAGAVAAGSVLLVSARRRRSES